jgi:hypothetical protein
LHKDIVLSGGPSGAYKFVCRIDSPFAIRLNRALNGGLKRRFMNVELDLIAWVRTLRSLNTDFRCWEGIEIPRERKSNLCDKFKDLRVW